MTTTAARRPAREDVGPLVAGVICLGTPERFFAIGEWYVELSEVTDEEVIAVPDMSAPPPSGSGQAEPEQAEVMVDAGGVRLHGSLVIPDKAAGLVVFAHGSGSGRHSPRNRFVAGMLNRAGIGTLLTDLLTPAEEPKRAYVFNISLLAVRLAEITGWLHSQPAVRTIPVGYFGASTGAAAALWAAAESRIPVAAVVSRGGRPDLAGGRLTSVRAPVLLIVGGADEQVLDLNRRAQKHLGGESRLAIVPGATHLFEEPGALEQVADLAASWFISHFEDTTHDGSTA